MERIGLALGSGAARGWAHLGVLRALEEAGVRVDVVAGTSMGAFVGAVFAAGQLERLEEVALEMRWHTVVGLLDVRLRTSGLVDGARVEAFVREHVRSIRFGDLNLPFAAVATDLRAAEKVVLDSGDLIQAVRASISLPGIFTPVEHEGRFLVDGGLVDPVPVSVARALGADRVIAVDLNHSLRLKARARGRGAGEAPGAAERPEVAGDSSPPSERETSASAWLAQLREALNTRAGQLHPALSREVGPGRREKGQVPAIHEVLVSTLAIMEVRITEANLALDPPDLLIRPDLSSFTLTEFHRAAEAIEAGREATRAALAAWR